MGHSRYLNQVCMFFRRVCVHVLARVATRALSDKMMQIDHASDAMYVQQAGA